MSDWTATGHAGGSAGGGGGGSGGGGASSGGWRRRMVRLAARKGPGSVLTRLVLLLFFFTGEFPVPLAPYPALAPGGCVTSSSPPATADAAPSPPAKKLICNSSTSSTFIMVAMTGPSSTTGSPGGPASAPADTPAAAPASAAVAMCSPPALREAGVRKKALKSISLSISAFTSFALVLGSNTTPCSASSVILLGFLLRGSCLSSSLVMFPSSPAPSAAHPVHPHCA